MNKCKNDNVADEALHAHPLYRNNDLVFQAPGREEHFQDKSADIGDHYGGGSVQTGGIVKHIDQDTCHKCNEQRRRRGRGAGQEQDHRNVDKTKSHIKEYQVPQDKNLQ